MNDKAILTDLVKKISEQIPGFELRYKDESYFQKIIGKILFFNKTYMTKYITTMRGKVYYPSRESVESDPRAAWKILAHEYVHLLDARDNKMWFSASYLLPQLTALGALLALGAFWNLWFLVFLILLGALAPWPSKWRTHWEMRGYAMSMVANYWSEGKLHHWQKSSIARNFLGPNYYYMCRNTDYIKSRLEKLEFLIIKNRADRVTHFTAVADLKYVLNKNGYLKDSNNA